MTVQINHILDLAFLTQGNYVLLYFYCFRSEFLSTISRTLRALSPHCLFKSIPDILHLDMPCMTPSGLTIGKIMNSNCSCSQSETTLLCSSYFMRYSAMKEPTVSQGCCLARMRNTGFSFCYRVFLPNLIRGIMLFDIE